MTEQHAVHVKNLEKYHANYKDRTLIWCKVYFTMLNADPEFEMIEEIDKWRLLAFVMLELQIKKPVPLNEKYLKRKGFNLKKRSISLTLQMLHNFLEVVTVNEKVCDVYKSIEEKNKVEKSREESVTKESFQKFWHLYPKKVGENEAEKVFNSIRPDKKTLAKICSKVEIFKKSDDWIKDNGQFIPFPAKWLRGERWKDEIVEAGEVSKDHGVVF